MILSPSYKRAGICSTHKIIPGVTYCVHAFEANEYRNAGLEVEEIPDKVRGNIARVRNWMLEYSEKKKEKRVLMVDDDLVGLIWWEKNDRKDMDPEWAEEFIENGFNMAEGFGAKLWGMNVTTDKGSYREYTPFSMKSYISASFSGHLLPTIRYDERFSLKEDYDFTIQILQERRRILRFNMVYYNARHINTQGGCADYRLQDREKDQLKLLQEKWGSKIVKFDTKSDGTFDTNPIIKVPINGV